MTIQGSAGGAVMKPAVQSFGLTRRFGDRVAVDGLNLAIEPGEVLGLLGPNGAGKTTTIRMLAGIISPTQGYAMVAGLRADREPEALHEHVGLLTETPGFYDRLSALDNLRFFASMYGSRNLAPRVGRYLNLTGLWDRRDDRVGTFSKGMKQRLALARALIHEPEVLLMDEPTAGLDPEAALEVRGLISDLSSEGRAILLCTHLLPEAEELCHRICVFRTRLIAAGTPEALRARLFRRRRVVTLSAGGASAERVAAALTTKSWIHSTTVEGNALLVEPIDPEMNGPELVQAVIDAGGLIISVTEEKHSLEDVYLTLVRQAPDVGVAS